MNERWDIVPRVVEDKRIVKVTVEFSDGSVEVFPRDFSNKRGEKGKFGESGKATVLAVFIAGKDGEDFVTVLRGVYSRTLIAMMMDELANW